VIPLQPFRELFLGHFNVPQNLAHKAWPDRLSSVAGYYCRSAIAVPKKMVAASDSQNHKSGTLKGSDYLAPAESSQSTHSQTATR